MSAFEQQQIDRLESQLADLSIEFYVAQDDEQRRAIASRYEVVFRQLEEAPSWCGEPHLDSQLPDEWMPATSGAAETEIEIKVYRNLTPGTWKRKLAEIQQSILDEREQFEAFKAEQLKARNRLIQQLGLEAHYDLTAENLVEVEPREISDESGAGQAHP